MGDRRSTNQVGTFPSYSDDLVRVQVSRLIRPADREAAWSSECHCVIPGWSFYLTLLEECSRVYGDPIAFQHSFPPSDRWTEREDDTDIRGPAQSLCARLGYRLGSTFTLGRVRVQQQLPFVDWESTIRGFVWEEV